jgi:hypothetical protein
MERKEREWVRGAAVIAVAGTLLALALMSPAAAGKFASKGFVNRKIDALSNRLAEVEDVNQLTYVQGAQLAVSAGGTGRATAVCPPGSFVTGGGGGTQFGEGTQIDSYPSNGTATGSGRPPIGNTAWVFEYEADPSTAENIRAYAICSRVDSTSGFTEGGPPA